MESPLPLSSLRLLVPPLRVMTAVMWKVVRLRNIMHYGKVEEFVSLVTEAIPDILTDRQMRLLTLGLRAKMTLQMLTSEQSEDLRGVKTRFLPSSSKQVHPGNEALETNFVRLVQRLLEDPKGREHFLKNVFPVEYGPDFDTALETLVCEFFTRLDELLLIPDFKQTAVWISDTPSVLEEYMPCVSKADDLKVLLRSKAHCGKMAKMDTSVPSPSEQRLFSSLSLPSSLRETNGKDVESNTETLQKQRESEGISPQDAADMAIQDTRWPSEAETNILDSSNAEQTTGGECSDSIPDAHVVEEYDDRASDTCRSPSMSTDSPLLSSSVIDPPRQRVAQKCTQCGKCFIYLYELLEHQRLHTGENPYKCSQCGKAFRRTSDLSSHRRTQCTKAAYICIKCGNSFQSVQEKFRHLCVHSVKRFDCSQCGKSFKKMHLLGKHELTHTQNRIFTCRQCGEVYPSMSELRSHQKIHPPELSNQCMQCGKFFSSAACLTAHELRHRQQKTQICVRCGKAFKNKHDLNLHMRSHTGERPFQCTYCGKRFSVSGNLNIHIRIHTGEKPYLCSDCGKAFVSAGELQIHRRTHTGEKPYKCTVCGRGFTMASKVTLHMRVHTGERPYICSECGKGFSRGSELKKHTMNHTGVRPYACQLCAKTYTCLNHLKRHLKTHSVVQNQTNSEMNDAEEFSVPFSSLALLVPPLRLMSAVMWEVVRQRNIKHYGKLEEFVSMVTDAVPELMSKREGRLLSLGLRARTTLELLRSEHPEDLKAVESHLNRIRTSCIEETNDPVIEAPEANFMKLVQGLIEDSDGREHFLKNVFPVEYGPDFDTALETLVCEFFTRLEELLPIPDFKQTASWISAAPSVLEEYMQCVSNGDELKFLLQSKQCHGKLAKSSIAPFPSDDLLIPSLSLPPSLEVAIASHPSACDDENNDVPQIVMFDEELSTNPSTSTDFPESPKRTDISSSPRRRQSGLHKCPECDKCFKHHSVLIEHQRVHSGLQPYNCSECGRAFRTATLLAGHRLRKCKNAAYLCIKCGNSFPTSLDKFRHHCPKRGRSYDCGHCGKSFQKSSSLKEHLLTHVQSRLFKCSHCGVGFSGIGDLKYHQQVDHDKPYQCKQCGKSFISSKCLTKHQQRHEEVGEMESAKLMSGGKHRKSGSAHRTSSASMSSRKTSVKAVYARGRVTHNCPLCGRSFKYRFEFLEHQRFHTAVKPYKCSQCGKAFRTEAHLSRHRKRKCKNASHICTKCGCQFRSLHERVRHQCVQLLTKYECSHCGKTFKMAHLLRNHQMSEHQLPYSANHRFRCRYCDETFPGISELKYHQRVDHEKPYQCQECGKCFLSEKCLANHELRHNDDRPESCLVCGRGFRNRYDLKQHMRTHTGERPYQCTHCSQCFSTAGGLRSHTRVHTGEKPHVCPDCGKAFSQMGAMRTHRLTHTGERPFKCTVCGKGFTMAHKVTVHMRVHTGERPYVCTQCGKAFSDGSVLKQHMLNHSGVRPYHCQICPKTYTCLNHLRRHLKSHSNMS
ncbi:uncharacterized protein LOC115022414 [Cottoperca gobio]|uniref:Uncharacterized protein LOC115022414 n=1 Tax=Cottoperca gobio TaxID=56716 RepID=A0A6J2RGK2_COTGO|nr:uncharacterized protein LOC115022414 [Cottoperca gobio]